MKVKTNVKAGGSVSVTLDFDPFAGGGLVGGRN